MSKQPGSTLVGGNGSPHNYHLPLERQLEVERSLVSIAREANGNDISAIWVPTDSEYADFVRTKEAGYFPEVEELEQDYDDNQNMFLLVDGREDEGKVLHAQTLMPYRVGDPDKTGFYTVDSLISHGNFTRAEFEEFHLLAGISLRGCVSIETNFRIAKPKEKYLGVISPADLAYVTAYNEITGRMGSAIGETIVFATMNQLQSRSLDRLGIDIRPLMDRGTFITEEEEHGVESRPVSIYVSEKTAAFFDALGIVLPEVRLT